MLTLSDHHPSVPPQGGRHRGVSSPCTPKYSRAGWFVVSFHSAISWNLWLEQLRVLRNLRGFHFLIADSSSSFHHPSVPPQGGRHRGVSSPCTPKYSRAGWFVVLALPILCALRVLRDSTASAFSAHTSRQNHYVKPLARATGEGLG